MHWKRANSGLCKIQLAKTFFANKQWVLENAIFKVTKNIFDTTKTQREQDRLKKQQKFGFYKKKYLMKMN